MSEGSDIDLFDYMENFDTILLGANTYKMFAEYWPDADTEKEIMADRLNSILEIVFQHIDKGIVGQMAEAAILKTDAAEAVKNLKSGSGKDMVLWGSISLAQALMKENLIDEYHLRIVPVLLGAGKRLFEKMDEFHLELFHSKRYPSGMMLLQYKTV